jgi:hypothetical protein
MPGGEQDAQRMAAMEKRAQVVELRREGLTFAAIGERMGFSHQRAQVLYRQALAAVVSPAVEALRAEHLAETAEARETALQVMRSAHVAHSQGRVVVDPDTGEKLLDDGPKLDAARTLMAVQAREAKLTGADAATKVEAEVSGQVDVTSIPLVGLIEAARLAVEAEEAALKGGGE